MAEEGRARAMASVQAIFERYYRIAENRDPPYFDYHCMRHVELLDAGPEGSVVFKFKVTPEYINGNNVLHGGAAALLFDMFTTTALGPVSRKGYWDFLGGVTRTLNVSYLRAVPIGTTVLFKSRVVQHGRTMAMIKGDMTSEDGKTVYCTAEHHKVNTPSNTFGVRIPWDDKQEQDARADAEKKVVKSLPKL